MAVVVDDHVLFDVLAGRPPAQVVDDLERGVLYTTGSWYYRLGRALHAGRESGSLSSRLTRLDVHRFLAATPGPADLSVPYVVLG